MRSPRPAASTMAARGVTAMSVAFDRLLRRREVGAVPVAQGAECRMGDGSLHIPPDARDVSQILGLTVAPIESRENPEDFRGTLRRQRRIDLQEAGRVEVGLARSPLVHIVTE